MSMRRQALRAPPSLPLWLALAVGTLACPGGDGGNERKLQCDCVRDTYEDGYFLRELPVGAECINVSISGCGCLASECIEICANEICQTTECATDADCACCGGIAECEPWIDSDFGDLGQWCNPSPDCPKGTPGCPCGEGGVCSGSGNGITVSCNAAKVCESVDSCPSGCRQSTVCCGGALCSGDCIGTPCC